MICFKTDAGIAEFISMTPRGQLRGCNGNQSVHEELIFRRNKGHLPLLGACPPVDSDQSRLSSHCFALSSIENAFDPRKGDHRLKKVLNSSCALVDTASASLMKLFLAFSPRPTFDRPRVFSAFRCHAIRNVLQNHCFLS